MNSNAFGKSEQLTEREIDVVELICEGMTNKQIANRLEIEEKTVKFHLTNAYRKLGTKTRLELVTRHFRAKSEGISLW